MSRVIDLAVKIASQADVGGFDRFGDAAGDMADKVASSAGEAASKVDLVSGAAEGLDDKAGRATGALGALSSGFELMGPQGEAVAAGLQTAAMATDFLSGASQALTLVMDLDIAKKAASTAATVAHTVATGASSAAAGIAAAGQWALNAALSANPIGLVVIALVALTAGVVLAYEKSETFRDVVDNAFKVATLGIRTTVDVIEIALDVLGDIADFARDKVPDAIGAMKDKVVPFLQDVVAPIKLAYDTMADLVDKIASIDFPDIPKLPDVNPFNNRQAADPASDADAIFASRNPRGSAASAGATTINVVVNQVLGDPVEAARKIREILARADRIVVA